MKFASVVLAAALAAAAFVALAPSAGALPTPTYYQGCPPMDPEEPHPCDPVYCELVSCTLQYAADLEACLTRDAVECALHG